MPWRFAARLLALDSERHGRSDRGGSDGGGGSGKGAGDGGSSGSKGGNQGGDDGGGGSGGGREDELQAGAGGHGRWRDMAGADY
eukprot:251031-Chlamydomonas_euryale.AAC.1